MRRFIFTIIISLAVTLLILIVQNETKRYSPESSINFIGYWRITEDSRIQNHKYSYVLEPEYIRKVRFYRDSWITRIFEFVFTALGVNPWAMSWGQNVFLTSKMTSLDVPTFAHELVHTAQYKKEGLLKFDTIYTYQFFTLGYNNIPYEIEAYEFGSLVTDVILGQ